jgi:hypothetical protein
MEKIIKNYKNEKRVLIMTKKIIHSRPVSGPMGVRIPPSIPPF